MAEQQSGRSLADDRGPQAGHRAGLLQGVQHAGERLQGHRVLGCEFPVDLHQAVSFGDGELGEAVELARPADHPGPDGQQLGSGGHHLADDLVHRDTRLVQNRRATRHSRPATDVEGRQIAAADAAGQHPEQHLARVELLSLRRRNESAGGAPGRDQRLHPHLSPGRFRHAHAPESVRPAGT